MKVRLLSPIIAFIIGAICLSVIASIQFYVFYGTARISMYIIPVIAGGLGALFVRYWANKLLKSKKEIRKQNERLDIAMESAAMGFWEWNQATEDMFFDQRGCELLGFSLEDMEHSQISWLERVHPDDIEQCFEDIRAHQDGEKPYYHNIHRIKHKDGRWIYILAQGKIIEWDKEGNATQFTGTFIDITERMQADQVLKANEHLYRELFHRSAISIWMEDLTAIKSALDKFRLEGVTDLDQYLNDNPQVTHELTTKVKVHQINEATLKLFRAQTQDQFFQQITSSFGDGAMEVFISELCAIWNGDQTFSAEAAFLTLDGQQIDTILSFHIPTSDEDFANVPISIIDITIYKQMEEEIYKSRQLESVGVLAGGIAHDFNNLLTGYFGNIELAKQNLSSEDKAFSYIETAGLAMERATNLTKQLLTFAKGGDPLIEIVGVKQIIEDSVKLSLSGSNILTNLQLPDDLWQVYADKGQLSQVMTNLIINADQAMPDSGTLTIKAKNIENNTADVYPYLSGNYVQFTISDTGFGITSTELGKIFDPYFTTKNEGSGLGLATVHSIITKHKGNISVESELGEGSTFTISLPAVKNTKQVVEVSTGTKIDTDESVTGNILVMDDNEMILELSTSMLDLLGYSVDTAIDGTKAIEKYIAASEGSNPFDVVIMDLTIPGGMGGKEAASKLLDFDPKAKVIVSSGYSTDPIMANFRQYGFKGRLAKPFQMDDMKKELSALISGY